MNRISRREALKQTSLLAGAALISGPMATTASAGSGSESAGPFRFCLNTSTIRGQKIGLVKEIEIAAQAGYQGIEPWVEHIIAYTKSGGSLSDLKKRITDLGLTLEDAISFPEWLVDDDAKRAKGFEQAKRDMDLVAQLGGKRLAAPPAGATGPASLDLLKAAERYRALLDAGDQIGVVPQLELWGFSQNLHRLSECAMVAVEAAHPKACILIDMFHLYKGGSDYRGLNTLSGNAIQIFHMNDYPADPPRDKINDSFRILPGDGVAPLVEVLRTLRSLGGPKVLSLELFNRQYWEQDPLQVAKTGLEKMKAVVAKAMV